MFARLLRTPTTLLIARRVCSSKVTPPPPTAWHRFWLWTTQPRPSWRESPKEAAIAFVVFGVTGSSSVAVVRPTLKATTGIEGSLIHGPNSYRVMSIVAVSPIYACMLVAYGTVAGRHRYFAMMAYKIFGRFLPQFALKRISDAFAFCVPLSFRSAAR
jgi:hypothetical protein